MCSGTSASRSTPEASRLRDTNVLPIADTRRAVPTQRIIASYQMPMLMMLRPDRSASWRQCSGASRSRKPVETRASTTSSSPSNPSAISR